VLRAAPADRGSSSRAAPRAGREQHDQRRCATLLQQGDLPPGLLVISGPTNVGVLRAEGRALLLNSASPESLKGAGLTPADVEWALITHHSRSAAEGLGELVAAGCQVAVPQVERSLFDNAEAFWAGDSYRVHCYHYHPSRLSLRESIHVARGLEPDDTFEWRGHRVRALSTPGPTDGGMTFLVEVAGKRVVFVGDLMCGPGRLWEMHSLQGSVDFEGGRLMEYHGFGLRGRQVLDSLERVLAEEPDLLVPSHGQIIREPSAAVAELRANLETCLASFRRISALQWHFHGLYPDAERNREAALARCRPLPPWVRELGPTSRLVVSDSGDALLIDCLGDVPQLIGQQREAGTLGRVEGIWITHYHDDHIGAVNQLRAEQECPVIAHESMVDILRRPDAYLMPCLDPNPIAVDRVTRDGESWEWREFRLTAHTLPGQSIYDAALLVERGDESILFIGDSFSPSGIDDYCTQNRNLLGPGLGYDRCLALLEGLEFSGLLVNEHVPGAFTFRADEIAGMREELARRRDAFRKLMPCDDPNYGLDPQWVRVDPYRQEARPGAEVRWRVIVRNYSCEPRQASVALRPPSGWTVVQDVAAAEVAPGAEATMELSARVPDDATGRAVAGFAVTYGGTALLELAEGIVDVRTGG